MSRGYLDQLAQLSRSLREAAFSLPWSASLIVIGFSALGFLAIWLIAVVIISATSR